MGTSFGLAPGKCCFEKWMSGHRALSVGLLLVLAISSSVYGRDRPAAREAYKEARQYHDQLLQTPEFGSGSGPR